MIIQCKNGSTIKSLSGGKCKRSKRGQKQIEKIRDYYLKYPDEFFEDFNKFFEDFTGCKLLPYLPYQRVILRIIRGRNS